jgi:phosphoribosylamine--glycine ligase
MARAGAFAALQPARALAAVLAAAGEGVVVKADGLAAGKGVTVCDTLDEAEAALAEIFADGDASDGRPRVVVEERLRGLEASVIAICDDRDALALPAARDHKRLGDGDSGPNTGGMGAYSPLPDLDDEAVAGVVARFHRPALAELARRGTPFGGALYAGLIMTPDRGPVLLEFNARFGDPETQAILPRVAVPLAPLLLAAARRRLGTAASALGTAGALVPAVPGAAVAIVLATREYPSASSAGDRIDGLAAATEAGALVFHAGTRRAADGTWETDGGRALAVVGLGADLASARASAETAADSVSFPGSRRRRDIAAPTPAASPAATASGIAT